MRRDFAESPAPQRAVRPVVIVVDPPSPDDDARVGEPVEPALVQALVAGLVVEAPDERVVCRRARTAEARRDAVRALQASVAPAPASSGMPTIFAAPSRLFFTSVLSRGELSPRGLSVLADHFSGSRPAQRIVKT